MRIVGAHLRSKLAYSINCALVFAPLGLCGNKITAEFTDNDREHRGNEQYANCHVQLAY